MRYQKQQEERAAIALATEAGPPPEPHSPTSQGADSRGGLPANAEHFVLSREDGKLGLSIVGDASGMVGGTYIKKVRNQSAAAAGLKPMSRLLRIGEEDVTDCTQSEVVNMLGMAGDRIDIVVAHDPEGLEALEGPTLARNVTIHKGASGFGLVILGSEDVPGPVFIATIRQGTMAAELTDLHVGDRIIAINGVAVNDVEQGTRQTSFCNSALDAKLRHRL